MKDLIEIAQKFLALEYTEDAFINAFHFFIDDATEDNIRKLAELLVKEEV